MKVALVALFTVMALSCGAAALAEISPMGQQKAMPEPAQDLDQRYMSCMSGPACSVQDRLQIMREMHDRMIRYLEKISQSCTAAGYKNCIDPQKDEVQQWQRTHDHMQQMMQSLESEPMGRKEPGAGGEDMQQAPVQQQHWWGRVWPWYENK